ncbi:MAG TPA: hypothetical protein VLA52_17180 [Thermohalobaculum sp.]|nr:hypothetical protein [Thermohalobaculum sp.]
MTTTILSRPGFRFGLFGTLAKIGDLFVSIAAAHQTAADFERMNNRTDAQLAAQGLRRADVSRAVFERNFA